MRREAGSRARFLRIVKILKIWRDEYSDPRSWDNLVTMVCWHRRYKLGDRHDFRTPGEFLDWIREEVGQKNIVMLPLYIYDHGGITMRTNPFNDPWDSGQVGWIYITKAHLREEFHVKKVTAKLIRKAEDVLRAEVEEYDQYLRGDVYGFSMYDTDSLTKIDTCGNFFGDDPIQNGMTDYVPEFKEKLNGVRLRDGLVITEDGKMFDGARDVRGLVNAVFPEGAQKYFAIRELVS